MRQKSLCAFMLLIALCVPAVAGAVPLTYTPTIDTVPVKRVIYRENPMIPGISPTTGLPTNSPYKPLVVQMNNSAAARPHWNMSSADIVYESILWAPSHTRYTLVFNDNYPTFVGSVRSARLHHASIRQEWDAPFVFWGAQDAPGTNVYEYLREHGAVNDKTAGIFWQVDGNRSGAYSVAFTRDNRARPHDVSVNLQRIIDDFYPDYTPRNHAFKFSDTPTIQGDTALHIDLPYGDKDYHPSYDYNEALMVYERSYNGAPQIDGATQERIVAANVIVQRAKLSYYGGIASRPVITLVGTGEADYFIGGQHIKGTWVRQSDDDRTIFLDESGKEITLLQGKTFIQIVANTMVYTYTRADGSVVNTLAAFAPEEVLEDIDLSEEGLDNME